MPRVSHSPLSSPIFPEVQLNMYELQKAFGSNIARK